MPTLRRSKYLSRVVLCSHPHDRTADPEVTKVYDIAGYRFSAQLLGRSLITQVYTSEALEAPEGAHIMSDSYLYRSELIGRMRKRRGS